MMLSDRTNQLIEVIYKVQLLCDPHSINTFSECEQLNCCVINYIQRLNKLFNFQFMLSAQ